MKQSRFRQRTIVCLMLLLLSGLYAESFRVRKTAVAVLETTDVAAKASLGFNDVLALTLPANRDYLQGIELEFKIPSEMLTFKHCIGFSFYADVTPPPDVSTIDYTGNRLFIDTIPSRLSMVLQIPAQGASPIPDTPYARILPLLIGPKDSVLFLRLQPIMKGLPDNVEELVFEVTIKSVCENNGKLNLHFIYPDKNRKDITVFIDEKPVGDYAKPISVTTGMHYLAVTSDAYRTEVRTFAIEQAKTTTMDITLMDTAPALIITAPDNAAVYLDNVKITLSKDPVIVQQGEHTIKFVVGDYEVSKTLSVINGKTYNVSLTVDVQLSETP